MEKLIKDNQHNVHYTQIGVGSVIMMREGLKFGVYEVGKFDGKGIYYINKNLEITENDISQIVGDILKKQGYLDHNEESKFEELKKESVVLHSRIERHNSQFRKLDFENAIAPLYQMVRGVNNAVPNEKKYYFIEALIKNPCKLDNNDLRNYYNRIMTEYLITSAIFENCKDKKRWREKIKDLEDSINDFENFS